MRTEGKVLQGAAMFGRCRAPGNTGFETTHSHGRETPDGIPKYPGLLSSTISFEPAPRKIWRGSLAKWVGLGGGGIWVLSPALLLICWETLGKSFPCSLPQFPHPPFVLSVSTVRCSGRDCPSPAVRSMPSTTALTSVGPNQEIEQGRDREHLILRSTTLLSLRC